jgi:hypothetical protein
MDGTKVGCWNDRAGESVGEGDGLRDELPPMLDDGGSSWAPYSS